MKTNKQKKDVKSYDMNEDIQNNLKTVSLKDSPYTQWAFLHKGK